MLLLINALSRKRGILLLTVLCCLLWGIHAEFPCQTDEDCQVLLKSPYTTCRSSTQTCSNPFQQGCLRNAFQNNLNNQDIGMMRETLFGSSEFEIPRRVCNSNDYKNDNGNGNDENVPLCKEPEIYYPELRIHNADWSSSMILAWIYQIVLSELVFVPATVGLTSADTPLASFYSENTDTVLSSEAYPLSALEMSDRLHDPTENFPRSGCATVNVPCVDVLPEVWSGQATEYRKLEQKNVIEPTRGNGILGRSGLYIPAYTAEAFPQFSVWLGLAGEENRQQLADTFLRPITWKEYCDTIDVTNCATSSVNATRYPLEEEEDLFFADFAENGQYNGHFVKDPENDCTTNPQTCTGHVITPPCSFSSPLDAQLHWNNIVGLSQDKSPEENGTSYTKDQMTQVYQAANATRSHVITYWYEPEPLHYIFQGTESEFIPVTFPPVSLDCVKNRVNAEERCHPSLDVRRGSIMGACGDDVEATQRLIANWMREDMSNLPVVDQSPALELLHSLQVTNVDIGAIAKTWKQRNDGINPRGHDVRVAVCDWVVLNLDTIRGEIPLGYPRKLRDTSTHMSGYAITAIVLASAVAGVALLAFLLVLKYRETKTMIFSQPLFLLIINIGFALIATGAALIATEPDSVHCVASAWLVMIGCNIELVPVVVKTAKINHLIRSFTKSQRRVQVKRSVMMSQVALVIGLAIAFMITWTVVDPPKPVETRSLDDSDASIVNSDVQCQSETPAWRIASFVWNFVLLILAALLAFQSRGVMEQLNESRSLAVMVYSHFFFVCIRGICHIFFIQETFPASVTSSILSLSYSLDALAAMAIYVFPKILAARNAPEPYVPGRLRSTLAKIDSTLMDEENDEDVRNTARSLSSLPISILVCSGNLGNAEPTLESMMAWVPPLGRRSNDTKSKKSSSNNESFDLIAIGMQEATWQADSGSSLLKKTDLTEEEVLNALEEANTVRLRELVQETLGENYFQCSDERRGQMRLQIWAKGRVVRDISKVEISGANTGIGNMLANKGGIVATVYLRETRLTFITAHLAAHEGESYYKARCDNIYSILQESKTFDLKPTIIDVAATSHHTFFVGDLNFRTRFPDDVPKEEKLKRTFRMIKDEQFDKIYEMDELQEGLTNGDFLAGFKTLPCPFPPTFKVERQSGLAYKDQRIPSYTDRILYRSSPGLEQHLQQLTYEACIGYETSDHKPIRGEFSLLPNLALDPIRVDAGTAIRLSKIRCSRLRTLGAKLNPYVMLLWDGAVLSPEYIAPLDFFRALWLGTKSWPRTSTIQKTSNPYWKGESLVLDVEETKIGEGALVFLAVMNHNRNFGRHELLGSTTLSLKKLLASGLSVHPIETGGDEAEKIGFDLEETLTINGKESGHIKFQIVVDIPTTIPPTQHRKRTSLQRFSSARHLLKHTNS